MRFLPADPQEVEVRYYDAGIGQFLNRDPIGDVVGTNLYGYVGDRPVRGIAPSGLCDDGTNSLIDIAARRYHRAFAARFNQYDLDTAEADSKAHGNHDIGTNIRPGNAVLDIPHGAAGAGRWQSCSRRYSDENCDTMRASGSCCRHLLEGEQASPFGKIIALGYYDGPTSGVLQCDTCDCVYWFEMIDWDAGQDVRLFSLAALPPGSLERVAQVSPKRRTVSWPVWVPDWVFSSAGERAESELRIQEVMDQAGLPLFAAAFTGAMDRILAVRALTNAEHPDVIEWSSPDGSPPRRDWFAFLGLPRGTG